MVLIKSMNYSGKSEVNLMNSVLNLQTHSNTVDPKVIISWKCTIIA